MRSSRMSNLLYTRRKRSNHSTSKRPLPKTKKSRYLIVGSLRSRATVAETRLHGIKFLNRKQAFSSTKLYTNMHVWSLILYTRHNFHTFYTYTVLYDFSVSYCQCQYNSTVPKVNFTRWAVSIHIKFMNSPLNPPYPESLSFSGPESCAQVKGEMLTCTAQNCLLTSPNRSRIPGESYEANHPHS